ncbi:MAG: ABC transporter substrate-binding protein [Eubacteriales bacterium]|nr:ABC transporter substrate-binding protein [Eubacteriales bacterium]
MRKIAVIFISLLTILALGLTACGPKLSPEEQELALDSAGEKPSSKRTRLELAIPPDLDSDYRPALSSRIEQRVITAQLYEGLCGYNTQGKVRLQAAAKILPNADYTQWVIHLRDDLKWSDGTSLTAEDFKNSWVKRLKPESKAELAFLGFKIKAAEDYYNGLVEAEELGITVKDNSLIIDLIEADENFPEWLTRDFFLPEKELAGQKLYNGPYCLKSETEEELILEHNPQYWDDINTHIKEIRFRKMDDPVAAYEAFVRGDIDYFGLPFYQVPHARREACSRQPEFISAEIGEISYLDLSAEEALFSTFELRKALYQALDVPFILRVIRCDKSEALFEQAAPDSKLRKELQADFPELMAAVGLEEKPREPLIGMSEGSYLEYRELIACGKQWLDLYQLRLLINEESKFPQEEKASFIYRKCLYGSNNQNDLIYYLKNQDKTRLTASRIFTVREEFASSADFPSAFEALADSLIVLPLAKLNWQILIQAHLEGFYLPPNALVRLQDLNLR